ncbi:MAG: glycine--tRNA ligase [Desulfurococcaceae archaeon]
MVEQSVKDIYDLIVDLGKRRGLFWSSYEIYGGLAGFYDFGPVGVLIKRNIMNYWISFFVRETDLVVEIETPIITPRAVLQASGHEDHFTDPVVECLSCGRIFRADHLIEEQTNVKAEGLSLDELYRVIVEKNVKCPECGGNLSKPSNALLLFRTEIGPYKGSIGYIRPEAAQGMFTSFKNILNVVRYRLPIGVAQVGKVCRNEISPRQGLIRLREFTIMEFEFFFDPTKAYDDVSSVIDENVLNEKLNILSWEDKERGLTEAKPYTVKELIETGLIKTPWLAYWMGKGNIFVKSLGIPDKDIRFEEKGPFERAHYSEQTFDQEVYTQRFGWIEVAGYSYRTNYDLERHSKFSNADLTYFRKYDKPIDKVVKKLIPNPSRIREVTGESFPQIMKLISEADGELLMQQLIEKNYVEIGGFKLTRDCFVIKEEVVKIYGEKIFPHVVEPSFGLERLFYVVIEKSLTIDENRIVLRIKPFLAPYQVAVFPLLTSGDEKATRMVEIARKIHKKLLKSGFWSFYDEEGSIGRRYARADEIGIPYCVTIDHQTLEDKTVTIRDRDTRSQIRVHINELYDKLMNLINYKNRFESYLDGGLNE